VQRSFATFSTAAVFLTLVACGGGGGGGSTAPNTVSTATPAPSVSGDMLALKPSQGWNYQSSYNNNPLTVTLYSDPNPVGGVTTLVGAGESGLVTTVATSAATMQANLVGALGVKVDGSKNYNVYSELSAGSTALVPGTPLLVPSTLKLGQTWTPATGASATVTSIGAVPGQSACPNASASTTGAEVQYSYPGYEEVISYVPGCGITSLKNPTNGATLTLTSTASYPSVGALARRAAEVTYFDTAASLLGQRRNDFGGAKLLNPFLK
jgi:hypothetical protein